MNALYPGIRWISEIDHRGRRLRDLGNVPDWRTARWSMNHHSDIENIRRNRLRVYMHPRKETRP